MVQYVLGTDSHEFSRLELQQEVWGPVTERFLDHLRLHTGARVLDIGCGPGFVLQSLRSRVGTSGRLTALDESAEWMTHVARSVGEHDWRNVHMVQKGIQDFRLEPEGYDLIFMRWVLSFLPQPAALVERLARALRPSGVLAVQDYNHEGCSLFPESAAFTETVRATRELIGSRGGDLWVAARLPGYMRAAGLKVVDNTPHVLSGAPGSPAFRWADAFFPHHSRSMVEEGVLKEETRDLFLADWEARKANPDAMFFSPIVVDCAGRRP